MAGRGPMTPRLFVVAVTLLAVACSKSEVQQQGQLMDEVERQVQLPKEALRLDDYARFYAPAANDEILGTYVVPAEDTGHDCEKLVSSSVRCPSLSKGLKAGQRQWLDNSKLLPVADRPGCAVVNVVYDPATGEVDQAFCNSPA